MVWLEYIKLLKWSKKMIGKMSKQNRNNDITSLLYHTGTFGGCPAFDVVR